MIGVCGDVVDMCRGGRQMGKCEARMLESVSVC